jgi:hypothetical protein
MLQVACNVIVLRPSEFLSIVRQHLETQDNQRTNQLLTESSPAVNQQNGTKTNEAYYKGYIIGASPYQLADSGEFTINISIRRDTGSAVKKRRFHAANTFKTKKEAIDQCIDFGRRIIDGEYANCTVSDL